MAASFDYIQTFYINPDLVPGAQQIMLTSVDLYFKGKPTKVTNTGGFKAPGMTVWICEVANGSPMPERIYTNSIKNIVYDSISTSSNASTPTTIGFVSPVIVTSGQYYGIVIKYDDPAFDIWTNHQNHGLVDINGKTNKPSTGSQGRFSGFLHKATNTNTYEKISDSDLKFKCSVAKFTTNTKTISLVNKPYEFFTVDSTSSGAFSGGEWVYQNVANGSGTVAAVSNSTSLIGTSTVFTSYIVGSKIVLTSGGVTDVINIASILDNTNLTLDRAPSFTASVGFKVPPIGRIYYTDYTKNSIILVDSSANSTVKFVVGDGTAATRLVSERSGATANVASIDRYPIDNFKPTFLIANPSSSNYALNFKASTAGNTLPTDAISLDLLKYNTPQQASYILSRSVEVDATKSTGLFGTNSRSVVANLNITVNISSNNVFSVPYINTGELDFYFYQNDINNTSLVTRNGDPTYDSEVDKNGVGRSKYISKKISFASDRNAEDVVAYVTGRRPFGTQINVYAKIINSVDKDTFDDKSWTPLELKSNTDKFSTDDPNDLYEYSYGFPQYPEVITMLPGTAATTSGNNIILTTADQSLLISAGNLVRVYDPILSATNHEVFVALGSNATSITLNKNITNINIIGNMSVDKLKYNNVAWNNIANGNTVRYVSQSLTEFDTYSAMQIKIVLLSDTTYNIPSVDQIQVIGVST